MSVLFSAASGVFADYLTKELKARVPPIGFYVKKFALGSLIILGSLVFWASGILFALLAAFFAFSDLARLTAPALWTALISCGLGTIAVLIGKSQLSPKRD
jgi:hypothetical protein